MSGPTTQCPSCGASVSFRWAGAVQTTCGYCDSILVRHGTDLERVGKVSEPPPITSPVQLGTEGSYRGRSFTVVGRIAYGYERGGWSEWHLIFADGRSGWLSDALLEYEISFLVEDPGPLPSEDRVEPGLRIELGGDVYEVTDTTPARYLGTEGELPWEYHDRGYLTFADLRTAEGKSATLDYSEDPPLAFAGEYVSFDSLRLRNVREEAEEAAPAPDTGVRTLSCPNCGSSVEVRRAGMSVNVVCEACASVLDATAPGAKVLQTFERRAHIRPLIPLGSEGRWRGADYVCLGFQVRTMHWGSERYSWSEYLLHNPEEGFRYLTEEDGHWNDAIVLKSLPERVPGGGHEKVRLHGETFKHFEGARTTTDYVLGEWPWEVRVGDEVHTDDYVSPPRSLSRERSEEETVWSLAEYVPGRRVWDAFGLPGKPPKPRGVYSNQPSPYAGSAKPVVRTAGILLALLVGFWFVRVAVLPNSERILTEPHTYTPPADSAVVVLGPFTLDGRTSNLAVDMKTSVSNEWVYFDYALMNTGSGNVREFGREVSYYFGREGGESWSEGSTDDRAVIPAVSPGEYMLRIAPEGPTRVTYQVTLRRDVPVTMFYLLALIVILLPAAFAVFRYTAFESKRWAESDYADDD